MVVGLWIFKAGVFCSCCIIGNIIFTARNSKCGKVMFSQAYVIPSAHRGGGVLPRGEGLPRGVRIQGGSASGGLHRGGGSPLPQSETMGYGQRVGGTHPTGMHSCVTFDLYLTYHLMIAVKYSRDTAHRWRRL